MHTHKCIYVSQTCLCTHVHFLFYTLPISADAVLTNLCLLPPSFNKNTKCPVATGNCAASPLRLVQLQEELRSSCCCCRWS